MPSAPVLGAAPVFLARLEAERLRDRALSRSGRRASMGWAH
jgi:hypothetical protein